MHITHNFKSINVWETAYTFLTYNSMWSGPLSMSTGELGTFI